MDKRYLTIGEQHSLAMILRTEAQLVQSDSLAPLSVNTEVNTLSEKMIDAGILAAMEYRASHKSRNTHDLVVSILEAALDTVKRGQQEDRNPPTG